MTAIITEREVISEFLEMYKEFTCLWDISCKQYSNKDARNQALQVLLEKLKVIDKEASIATVKKKIENMRAAYKRELKKVNKSITIRIFKSMLCIYNLIIIKFKFYMHKLNK